MDWMPDAYADAGGNAKTKAEALEGYKMLVVVYSASW